ncbi:hypothetical protein CYMTET_26013 [Cymbomonas tetramitiformis]|uniref:Ubiquitin-like domain-containing protein n=1 Tax=Cymbomonas tetramitiformis TaxID=36881 RepID=A0AAE0KYH2_9CHLO|nr:hypothetical protein CYMTET_26013 [Cymbomonas tetramitiformis]
MVQILIHVFPLDTPKQKYFTLLDVEKGTRILEVKLAVADIEGAPLVHNQDLVFMGERCEDEKCMSDYGICEDFILQVTGFVINPPVSGKKFVKGKLTSVP